MTLSECSQMIIELENEMMKVNMSGALSLHDKQDKLINLLSVRDSLRGKLITLLRRENQELYLKLKKVS